MYSLESGQRKISVMSGVSDIETESIASDGDGLRKRSEMCDGNLRLCATIECTREVMCVRFSPDGSLLAVGQADGLIKIYQGDSLQNHLYTLSDEDTRQTNLPVTCIRFKPSLDDARVEHKHILIATYASGNIKFWHYTSGHCLQTINEVGQTLAFSIKPSGHRFVTCGEEPQLHLYDMETKQQISTMEASDSRDYMDGHRERVFAVQYHPNSNHHHMIVSGGWDNTVQFWDDRERHAIRRLYGPHICGDSLDIDGTHNHILTGSWKRENVLQIWDFASGELIKNVPQDHMNGSLLYCCQWLGNENILCGGNDPNMARIIDRGTLNTVGQLFYLPKGVYTIDNDRQSKPRIAVGAACKVFLLKMDKKQ